MEEKEVLEWIQRRIKGWANRRTRPVEFDQGIA